VIWTCEQLACSFRLGRVTQVRHLTVCLARWHRARSWAHAGDCPLEDVAIRRLSKQASSQWQRMAAFGSTSFGAAASGAGNYNPNKDAELVSPPPDAISSLHFSPTSNFLTVTSWDNQVRCYEVQPNGQSQPKAAFSHAAPVLCSAWSSDGSKVFSAGCDNEAKIWDLASNSQQTVAKHDAPIRHMHFFNNMLVTGSWDKTLKYWDLRQANPLHTQTLPERVYGMDVRHPLLVLVWPTGVSRSSTSATLVLLSRSWNPR